MKYWKEHVALRMVLMLVTFVLGILLLIAGWGGFDRWFTEIGVALTFSGNLAGLGVMLVGIALLLTTLALYNKPFEEPKTKKRKV